MGFGATHAFVHTGTFATNTTEYLMEPLLGQIQLLPYGFAPEGWAICDGQFLSIAQNSALFSLLGTQYGGDGKTTFALPNLTGKAPDPNMQYCIALQGVYPSRG